MHTRYVALGLTLLWAGGCSDLWGIHDAQVDPTFRLGELSDATTSTAGQASPSLGVGGNSAHAGHVGGAASVVAPIVGGGPSASSGAAGASTVVGNSGGAFEGSSGGLNGSGGHAHVVSPPVAGGGVSGSVGGSSGTGGGITPPGACDEYCATVTANCTGDFSVYPSEIACRNMCQYLLLGTPGDTIGNTVHCRLRAAKAALAEVSYYCPIAGPGGNGACGSNCEGFCTLAQGVCTGANQKWETALSCKTECDKLPDLQTYAAPPSKGMFKGPHVQCRLYHVSAAAVADPALHCAHVSGLAPCNPP